MASNVIIFFLWPDHDLASAAVPVPMCTIDIFTGSITKLKELSHNLGSIFIDVGYYKIVFIGFEKTELAQGPPKAWAEPSIMERHVPISSIFQQYKLLFFTRRSGLKEIRFD